MSRPIQNGTLSMMQSVDINYLDMPIYKEWLRQSALSPVLLLLAA